MERIDDGSQTVDKGRQVQDELDRAQASLDEISAWLASPDVSAAMAQEAATSAAVLSSAAEKQAADLLQQQAKAAQLSAADAVKQLNEAVSAAVQPLYDAFEEFKKVPPMLNSVVDVQGAAAGMYADMASPMEQIWANLSAHVISSEVPITLDDYRADPQRYENLMAIEFQKNEITEEDCLSSGYTKVVWEPDEELVKQYSKLFQPPKDRDVVGKAMEKLVSATIKTAWQMVQPPIATVAGLAGIPMVAGMVTAATKAVDGVVKLAATPVSEKQLEKMMAQKQLAQAQASAEAQKAKLPDKGASGGVKDMVANAASQAQSQMSQAFDGASAGLADAFANFQAPALPDGIKETLEDLKDAIINVKDNIMNIYTVVLMKMMGAVFKCLGQITGVLGVPTIPDPLNKIPQLMADCPKVMEFVMGLPMSFMNCVMAIVKRRMKAIMIAYSPAPPPPVPAQVPVPPTSKEVVKPGLGWFDVEEFLHERYGFTGSDAEKIVERIRDFYGEDEDGVRIIDAVLTPDSAVKKGEYDTVPSFTTARRFKMTPVYCKDTWLPSHVEKMEDMSSGKAVYVISPPIKVSDIEDEPFFTWTASGKEITSDYDGDWCTLDHIRSKPV